MSAIDPSSLNPAPAFELRLSDALRRFSFDPAPESFRFSAAPGLDEDGAAPLRLWASIVAEGGEAHAELAEHSLYAPRFASAAPAIGGRIGAVYRFGESLSAPRADSEIEGLYFFAGADAQAVTWRLTGGDRDAVDMRLEDYSMVGDAQAGVALRLGAGDLSFGVIHREIRYDEAKAEETFGGLSFAIRN
ncbi:MAG: DUF2219 family protein [Maricaulaceae bacterium]